MELFRLLGTIAINDREATSAIDGVTGKASTAQSKMSKAFSLIGKAVAAGFAIHKIKQFGEACVQAYQLQEEAELKLETIMRQRMNATDESIQSVKDYASALQRVGVVGDEVQLAGAQQLATFLETDEALKSLMPAMNNLAVQQNGVNVSSQSMTSIANMMGKAMQGQASALTRVGITMTDTQKKMLEMGTEEERAAVLADIITDNVGNMNEVLAKTDAGRIQQVKNSFGDLKEVIGGKLMPTLGSIAEVASGAIQALSDLATGEKTLSQVGSQLFDAIIKGITTGIPKLANKAVELIDKFGNGLSSGLPKLLPKVLQIIIILVQTLAKNAPKIIKAGADLILKLAEGLIKSIPSLVAKIPQLISAIVSALKNGTSAIHSIGMQIIKWLWKGISSLVGWLGGKVLNFAKSIPKKIKAGVAGIASVGSNLVKGLWNGISNMASWIKSKIQGFGKSVLNALKDFFGIHSPSKVMEEQIGKNLALGVADGITKNKKYAKKSAKELAQVILDAAKKKLDAYKTYNDMTLAAEVAFWDEIRLKCKKGTDARLEADKQYFEAKKSLNEQLKQLEDDYISKIETANQKIADRANSLLNAFNLFDEFAIKVDEENPLTGETLINNLESQVNALTDWTSQMASLGNKIGNTELYKALQDMGVSSLQQVQLINQMSEAELNKYVELYNQRAEIAKKQAESELGAEVMNEMMEAYKSYEEAVSSLGAVVSEKFTGIGDIIETVMTSADSITGLKVENMTDLLTNGLAEMTDNTQSSFKAILESISASMASAVSTVESAVAKMQAALASVSGGGGVSASVDVSAANVRANAKGGILTKPTIFGYTPSTNTYQLGGEAGAEAIAPISTLKQYVAEAVASQNGNTEGLLQQMIVLLQKLLDKDLNTYLDGEKISQNVNKKLGFAL